MTSSTSSSVLLSSNMALSIDSSASMLWGSFWRVGSFGDVFGFSTISDAAKNADCRDAGLLSAQGKCAPATKLFGHDVDGDLGFYVFVYADGNRKRADGFYRLFQQYQPFFNGNILFGQRIDDIANRD